MARVVRSADRTVLLDATGRAAGRGAYLCHDESCLDQALRTKRLARALRVELTDVDHAALRRMFAEQEGVIAHGGN
ncbi:MAG: YlxR family protein [Actinomycetia bacterium]|nr:YlxR family protein [Actinomycetes bacterium]